jgi:hypothetical protein
MTEMLEASVGVFEVDLYVGTSGTAFALDPKAGQADLPEIIDVASETDAEGALQAVGVPPDEATPSANTLAPDLWARRWRGSKSPIEGRAVDHG